MCAIMSNFIDAVGWENGVFEVWMKNGTVYRYYNVPETRYNELFINSDFGRVFNRIKRDYSVPGYSPLKFRLPQSQ